MYHNIILYSIKYKTGKHFLHIDNKKLNVSLTFRVKLIIFNPVSVIKKC